MCPLILQICIVFTRIGSNKFCIVPWQHSPHSNNNNAMQRSKNVLPRLREPLAGLCQSTRRPDILVAKVDYRNNIFTQPSLSNCMQLIIIEHNMQPNPSLFSLIKSGIHQSILPMSGMQGRLNGRRVLLYVHTAQQECSQWSTGAGNITFNRLREYEVKNLHSPACRTLENANFSP